MRSPLGRERLAEEGGEEDALQNRPTLPCQEAGRAPVASGWGDGTAAINRGSRRGLVRKRLSPP